MQASVAVEFMVHEKGYDKVSPLQTDPFLK